jgi:hypothetical protein
VEVLNLLCFLFDDQTRTGNQENQTEAEYDIGPKRLGVFLHEEQICVRWFHVNTTGTLTILDFHPDIASVTPGLAPGIANNEVRWAAEAVVANNSHGVIQRASTGCRVSEYTRNVALESD